MVTFISLSLNVSFMLEPKQRRHPFIFMPQLDSLKLNKCEWPNTGNVFFKVFLFSVHIQISFYWHIRHFKPVWHSAPTWNDRKMIADDDDTIKACFYLLKPAAVNVHHIALCLDLSAAHIFIYFDLLGLGFMCQPHSLRTKSGPAHSWEWSPKQYTSSNCSCGLQSTWKKAEIAPLCPDTDPASWVGPRYAPSLLSAWKRLENGDLIAQQPKTENVNLGNFLRYAWNSWRYHGNSTQSVSKITAVIKSPDDKQHTCIEYWSCLPATQSASRWRLLWWTELHIKHADT